MKGRTGLFIGLAFAAIFVAILTASMMSLRKHRVEVCMAWNGRTECKVAAGTTKEEAQRTATDQACALISGGMTDSMNCSHAIPTSVKWLD